VQKLSGNLVSIFPLLIWSVGPQAFVLCINTTRYHEIRELAESHSDLHRLLQTRQPSARRPYCWPPKAGVRWACLF